MPHWPFALLQNPVHEYRLLCSSPHPLLGPHTKMPSSTSSRHSPISPFLLHPSSVTIQSKYSSSLYRAKWMRLTVLARPVSSQQRAIQMLKDMCHLRHPNLQQLFGAVVHPSAPNNYLVAEYIPGPTLHDFPRISSVSPSRALTIIKHAAAALLYLHKAATPHGAICGHSIILDSVRQRAILLLAPLHKCSNSQCVPAVPELYEGHRLSFDCDVYCFAVVIHNLFRSVRSQRGVRGTANMPAALQRC